MTKTGAFTFPQYVAVDESGNVYVTDLGNTRVEKFDNDGSYLHAWGSRGTGSSEFHAPTGIAVKNNYVYVIDHELSSVKKFDLSGNFIKAWGSEGSDSAKFKLPNGVAVSNDNFVYVVDTGNSRVQKFDSDGKFLLTIGSSGRGDGQFLTPLGIAIDSGGNIYVSDSGNNRIEKFTSDGTFVKQFAASSGGTKISPDGLAIDSSGNIIVADSPNNRVVVLDQDGKTVTAFGKTGTSNSQFKMAKAVAIDSDGDLFVVDSSNHRIQKFGTKDAAPAADAAQTASADTAQQTTTAPTVKSIVGDTKKPTIVPPKDIYVEATSGLTPVALGKAIANDESGIKSLTNNAPSEFPLGTTTVIWTAIDGSGNMGIATQTVTVGDSTPPVIDGLSDIVSEAQSTQNKVNLGNPTVTDSVGVMTVTNDAPETFPLGKTTVTWTAIDVARNVATATQIVTVTDTKAPKIKAPAGMTVEASSLDHNQINLGEATATDNSEIASITNDAPKTFPLGETLVTWTAADIAGNTATATQKIMIVDTTAPVIIQPKDISTEAVSASSTPVTLIPPNATDVQQVTFTNNAPEFFPIGQTKVTWTAIDPSGNNSTATQTVSVVDTTAPVLTVPENIIQEATGPTGNAVSLGEPTTQDISEISSVSSNAPSTFPFGSTIVTWTATDKYGNSVSANQNVTIIDTTPPKLTAPINVTIEATSVSENVVALGEPKTSDLVGVDSVTSDAPEKFPLGQTTVTWTAKDTSGNTATATQIVSVVDTTSPEITLPQDITMEATGPSGTVVSIGNATASDAIGIESITNDSPKVFNLGLTQVTWTVKDSSGNVATATQKVTIVDTTAPSITAPSDVTAEATSANDNTVKLGDAKATDAVTVSSVTSDAPEKFPLGETTVTWIATDSSGNNSTATQKVTIVDTTAPTLTAPSDVTVEATSKSDNTVSLETPAATDNVGVASVTSDAPEKFPVGETVVTWTAKDTTNNVSTVTQKVTIVDTVPPKFSKLSNVIVEATSNDNNSVPLTTPVVSDILDITSLKSDAPEKFPLGETTVTWTATDESGNSATATQKVTIVDTTAPSITAPSDVTAEATSANDNTVKLGDAKATDAVTVSSVTSDAPEKFPLGETTVTWTAIDSSGNNSTATQKVTIVDTTAPTLTAPENITSEATSATDNIVALTAPATRDSVSQVKVTSDAPEKFPLGETTVTWTATDESGNSATATQKVTIVDTTAPKLTIPDNIIIDAVSLKTPVSIGTPVVADLTDAAPKVSSDAPDSFQLGKTTITWTAVDKFGNSVSQTQTVEVDACGKPESSYNVIIGKEDDDILVGTSVADLIIGLGGDDIIFGEKGNDCILAGDGDDIVYGNEGNDSIVGGDGSDVIKGQSGDDILIGGAGIDVIDGGDDTDSCNTAQNSEDDVVIKCES
ncbi:MAG TPA: HYR domain-containing protein [Candidatus Nitrosotenuis sp.]|nr:HYR domain-containing protein [Candidatus Nitrosotenuis sp.]